MLKKEKKGTLIYFIINLLICMLLFFVEAVHNRSIIQNIDSLSDVFIYICEFLFISAVPFLMTFRFFHFQLTLGFTFVYTILRRIMMVCLLLFIFLFAYKERESTIVFIPIMAFVSILFGMIAFGQTLDFKKNKNEAKNEKNKEV